MAEAEQQQQQQQQRREQQQQQQEKGKGKGKGDKGQSRSRAGAGGLAPIQGENAPDERPPEDQPGTREHLGDDPVYAGDDSPYVEGDESARNR